MFSLLGEQEKIWLAMMERGGSTFHLISSDSSSILFDRRSPNKLPPLHRLHPTFNFQLPSFQVPEHHNLQLKITRLAPPRNQPERDPDPRGNQAHGNPPRQP